MVLLAIRHFSDYAFARRPNSVRMPYNKET